MIKVNDEITAGNEIMIVESVREFFVTARVKNFIPIGWPETDSGFRIVSFENIDLINGI